jgi:hypothetical protein
VNLAVLESVLVNLKAKIGDNPELEKLKELKTYDFKGTDNLWNIYSGKNYALARELSHRVAQKLLEKNSWNFMQLVQNATQKQFNNTPINQWGTTAGSMTGKVYGSHSEAIIDLARHDNRYAEWNDVKWYDFKKIHLTDERSRELTHLLLQKIMTDHRWDFVQLIKAMRDPPESCSYTGWKHAFQSPIDRYGASLVGVIDRHRDCPAEAVLDLAMNDARYKEFRDLSKLDFPDQRNIWNLKNGKKNYELARKATGILLKKLNLQDCALKEILENVTDRVFCKTEINRYGTKLEGMVHRTYNYKVRRAIEDWYNYDRTALMNLV